MGICRNFGCFRRPLVRFGFLSDEYTVSYSYPPKEENTRDMRYSFTFDAIPADVNLAKRKNDLLNKSLYQSNIQTQEKLPEKEEESKKQLEKIKEEGPATQKIEIRISEPEANPQKFESSQAIKVVNIETNPNLMEEPKKGVAIQNAAVSQLGSFLEIIEPNRVNKSLSFASNEASKDLKKEPTLEEFKYYTKDFSLKENLRESLMHGSIPGIQIFKEDTDYIKENSVKN